MTRKNILFIIPGLKGGGAEKVVASLSLDLIKNNNVFIALFNTSYGIGYPYGGEIINLDAPASHNSASNSVFLRVYRFFYLIAKLKKIKKQHAIDISISFLDNSNMVNLFSKNAGKTIISVRTFTSTYHSHMGWYGKSYSMLMRRFFHRADHIVVPSEGILEDLVDKYQVESSKISVINNSFTIAQIQSLSAEPVSEAYLSIFKSPVLIQVGRITQAKGQWHLIRAFSEVKKLAPEVKLVILGNNTPNEAPLKEYIFQLLNDYGLTYYIGWEENQKIHDQDVFFLGHQENPYKFCSKALAFCFSSLYEGFPNALVEAMACGLPVITTDCKSGPREILSPNVLYAGAITGPEHAEYGILMPEFNGDQLTSKENLSPAEQTWGKELVNFIHDENLLKKYKIQALKRASDFDSIKIFHKWEDLIG